MNKLNPEKLSVEYRPGVTASWPVILRHYMLTHSDESAELFLTIGLEYAYDKINPTRDEVLAQWRCFGEQPALFVYIYVDGQFGSFISAMRYTIFKRELQLALEAIRFGDRSLFAAHPELDEAPIWIYFDFSNPRLNRAEYWGMPIQYV